MPSSRGTRMLEVAEALASAEKKLLFRVLVGGAVLDEETLAVLEQLEEVGSLRGASERGGLAYARAWRRLSSVERALGVRLVERVAGGYGGGRSFLTPEGKLVLARLEFVSRKAALLSELLEPDLRIAGSDCPGVRLIAERLWGRGLGVEYAAVGSWNGVELLLESYCDIAGVHLLNPSGEDYNSFLLEDPRLRGKVTLVRGYRRRLGFLVKPGNPKSIRSFRDLTRPDVVFANRNRGSGTRSFVDSMLRRLAKEEGLAFRRVVSSVRGYETEYHSHAAVAYAVASGKADVGVALEWAAARYGLEFIPLQEEQYDFLVRLEGVRYRPVSLFIEYLGSEECRSELHALGFDARDSGEMVA
uniref:LysR family transcriptional regulator n=1 Tax=Thermofilum pendens TaxID=2269 RepID=A0A7C3SNP1_THEPE